MNMIKKISNKVNGRNYRKLAVKLSLIACTIAFSMCNACMFAFADNAENAKPTGAGGSSTMSNMVDIVFWVVRIIIVLVGGVPGIIKVVQGQADENPRDRNAGLAVIGIAGAAFAATFAVKALI